VLGRAAGSLWAAASVWEGREGRRKDVPDFELRGGGILYKLGEVTRVGPGRFLISALPREIGAPPRDFLRHVYSHKSLFGGSLFTGRQNPRGAKN